MRSRTIRACKQVTVLLALCLVVSAVVVPVASALSGFTGPYELQNWTAVGPGTKTVTPSSGPSSTATFQYALNGSAVWSPQTWEYRTTAATTGPVTFNWNYSGYHAFFQVRVFLRVFADGPSGRQTITLVSAGPVNCCSSPSGGFNYSGSTTFNVNAGYAFGIQAGGQNFDSDSRLLGKIDLSTFNAGPSDTTPPLITPNVSGTLGANGWRVSDTTVSWSVTDPDSAVTSSTGCGTSSITADTAGTTFTCVATSSGGTSSNSVTVKVDKSGPSAALGVTAGTPGANGWYTSDVTVGTTGSDAVSGPVTCTASQTQTTETAGVTFNGSCTNQAGLSTAATPLTVMLDKTGPSAALAVTGGTLGANGWYTSDVTVSTSGSDSVSGPATCTGDQFQAAETTGTVFSGSCTNQAGLSTTAAPLTVKLDKSGPSAALAVASGTLGANGWYTSDVTIATTGGDSISGPVTCTANQTQAAETTGATFNGSCANQAGLTTNAAPLTVKVDKTPPLVACAATPNSIWPPNHKLVNVNTTVSVTDTVSGSGGFVLTAATSDEPDNGLGDGDTANDLQGWSIGSADTAGQVRAERSGTGAGRVYTLSYSGTNGAGLASSCRATVSVPHSKGG